MQSFYQMEIIDTIILVSLNLLHIFLKPTLYNYYLTLCVSSPNLNKSCPYGTTYPTSVNVLFKIVMQSEFGLLPQTENPIFPPLRKTRCASLRAESGLLVMWRTRFEKYTSKVPSLNWDRFSTSAVPTLQFYFENN